MPSDVEHVVEGYYVGCLVRGLREAGAMRLLMAGTSATQLARAMGWDAHATGAVLDFLAARDGLVVRTKRGVYRLDAVAARPWAESTLEKFLGAYGPTVQRLDRALRRPGTRRGLVDQAALARAFKVGEAHPPVLINRLRRLAKTGVADLGCGTGLLLAQVCASSRIAGFGIDASEAMCRSARARIAQAGLSRLVRIRHGDAFRVARILSANARDRIDVIHAGSLLNAMCRDRATLKRGVASIRRAFPGRTLVVVDYLGTLTYEQPIPRTKRHSVLQDLVQVLSGQGVPPPSHDAWAVAYAGAGARLVEVLERRSADVRWFIHIVQL